MNSGKISPKTGVQNRGSPVGSNPKLPVSHTGPFNSKASLSTILSTGKDSSILNNAADEIIWLSNLISQSLELHLQLCKLF